LGVRRGLTIFGASERSDDWLSKADGSGDFTVADIQYSRYQKISDTWSFNFSAAAQLASTALLATEEYYLGGAAFGRAYDGGAVSGDNALAGSFELRYDQSVERAFLKGYQLYAFADHGVVWDFRPESDERFQLTSAGGGVRLFLPDDLQGSLELAVPVDRSSYVSDARDVSIYFSLSKALKACPAELTMRCPSQ
jgi:hemolysin activation/secretion protein